MSSRERTAHGATHVFGLALLSGAILVATVLALLYTEGEGTFIPTAVVALAVTWVVWRFDRSWAYVLGIIGTLAVTAGTFFLAFGAFQIFSPIEFIVGLALILGFFISLIAGVMALVASRAGRTAADSSGHRFRRVVIAAMGVLALISMTGFLISRSSVSDAQTGDAAVVDMTKFEFEPSSTTVSRDQMLLVSNSDPFAHDITLEEFDIYAYLTPGSEALVDLSTVPPGSHTIVCSLHTDPTTGEGMTAQLTVAG